MLFPAIILAIATSSLGCAQATNTTESENDYLNALAAAFADAGLTALRDAAARLSNTSYGRTIVSRLSQGGNYTIFAPTNEAFSGASDELASNDELLARLLSYHIVAGDFTNDNGTLASSLSPNNTVGRTLLNDTGVVQLEGNKSQVLVWSSLNDEIIIQNQALNITVLQSSVVPNTSVLLNSINGFLAYPTNTTSTLVAHNLTSLTGLLESTNFTASSTGLNRTLHTGFDEMAHGFTLFAPNNKAVVDAGDYLASYAGNMTAFAAIVGNHVINGTTLYSPELKHAGTLTSGSGEGLMFTSNSSGTFVTSTVGKSHVASARIIASDIPTMNGVIHIIDHVLLSVYTDKAAAKSAYESMTQSSGNQNATATETGAVGGQTMQSANGAVLSKAQLGNKASGLANMALGVLGLTTLRAAMI
ncbi:Fasciclin-domain-containing protein [Cylindrobasidium torrendii FP15055 ss-10]|uniref:Fasciclin-domain-containing protein n=1 Tax=Cylindrobasidium torrendii FP15055 ss-10 TaxID=1314674 RepID=A0A0D7BQ64_9AGAR|nr:Fasciclin-domain-containing protein [Cylindrobasidium torrendii FP15055 ss-10]